MFDQIYFNEAVMERYGELQQRRVYFSGPRNFRDLGGYRASDGRAVRWKSLYRSDSLHKMDGNDLKHLSALLLDKIIDFRSAHEKQQEPDRLPQELQDRLVEIPILDSSTSVWHDSREEFIRNLKNIDPVQFMIRTNTELVMRFLPEMQRFVRELLSAKGHPVLFHCAAGKDRTGFAAAILLRMLGIPQETVMEDYLLTNQYILSAYRWNLAVLRLTRGTRASATVRGFMEANPEYLTAAFTAIDRSHGSFEKYVRDGLGLSDLEVHHLRAAYLE